MQSKQRQTGLTMVELMIVVTIAAILASIAAPSFNDLINNTRLTSTMSQLTSDLNRARSEAIKRNSRVLVCVRAGTDAAPVCGAGTNWQNGWVVCSDKDTNPNDGTPDGVCDATSTTNPNPIAVHQALNARLTLTGNAASICFNPSGTQGATPATALCGTGNATLALTGATTVTATIAPTGNISKTP
ncbi:MAG: GspH/FimT family pseudopilin [Nitrosomonadales bacterium]|nr:GspH/FimT family pseudopilin [Nitrosomonadales bacterium]